MAATLQSGSAEFTPWRFGGLSAAELARRVWRDTDEVEAWGRAAQLAFYLLLALFPALLFLTALMGLFPTKTSLPDLMLYLYRIMPRDAISLVSKFIEQVIQGSGKDIVSLGFLGALWASSSGMTAVIEALNAAYHARETRPLWKVRAMSMVLTIGLAGFILASVALVLVGEILGYWVAEQLSLGWLFMQLWPPLKWPIVFLLMLFVVEIIYYMAPNTEQEWHWVTPGSAVAVSLWLLVSLGFKVYAENFGNYNAVYGSITGVIVLMLWFYLGGLALLLGGEINAVIAKAAATGAGTSKAYPRRRTRRTGRRQWVGASSRR